MSSSQDLIGLYAAVATYRVPPDHLAIDSESGEFTPLAKVLEELLQLKLPLAQLYERLQAASYAYNPKVVVYYLLEDKPITPKLQSVYDELGQISGLDLSSVRQVEAVMEEIGDYGLGRRYKRDYYLGEQALAIQEDLRSDLTKGVWADNYYIRSAHYTASVTSREVGTGRRPTVEWGNVLFDQLQVSPYIPYAYYVDSKGRIVYKIHRGDVVEDDPPYTAFIPKDKSFANPDTIGMAILVAPNLSGKTPHNKDSYDIVTYNIAEAAVHFQVNYRSYSESLVRQRLEEALPHLEVGEFVRGKLVATTNLYQQRASLGEMEDYIFLHQVLNNPTFSRFLYVKEGPRALAFKSSFRLQFRPAFTDIDEVYNPTTGKGWLAKKASVSFNLSIVSSPAGSRVLPRGAGTTPREFDQERRHYRLKITKADGEDAIRYFVDVMCKLMALYLNSDRKGLYRDLRRFYRKRLPGQLGGGAAGLPPLSKADKDAREKDDRKAERHIKELRRLAPDVFVKGYPSIASGKRQPYATKSLKEVKQWRKGNGPLAPKSGGEMLPFPPGRAEPLFWFGCIHDAFPHPGLTKNKLDVNSEAYPSLPQCYERKQMVPGKPTYAAYAAENPDLGEKLASERVKKTQTLLDPEEEGNVTPILESLFEVGLASSGSSSKKKSRRLRRLGVVRAPNPNSLIHCIFRATQHTEYLEQEDEDLKDQYVRQFRARLSERIHPALLAQELYDFTPERRVRELDNPDLYFNPRFFYRTLEELFKVNIFVFFRSTKSGADQPDRIDLPRARYFHIHAYDPSRPSVLIQSHFGTKTTSGNVPYPHCELLIQAGADHLYFGHDPVGIFCSRLIDSSTNLYTWIPGIKFPQLSGYGDIYNLVNWMELIGAGATHQIVDDYGKARAFRVKVRSETPWNLTLVISPSCPLNLPLIEADQLPEASTERVLDLLAPLKPSGYDPNGGLWFPLVGVTFGIYIPVSGQGPEAGELPEGPRNPLAGLEGVGSGAVNLAQLRRNLNFVTQLLYWVFDIYRQTGKRGQTGITGFVAQFMPELEGELEDFPGSYDISELVPILPVPRKGDTAAAMKWLAKHMPEMVPPDQQPLQFRFSPPLRTKLMYLLDKYQRGTAYLGPIVPAVTIANYYTDYLHYTPQDGMEVFLGWDDLQTWLTNRNSYGHHRYRILGSLTQKLSEMQEPYLYEQGSIMLVIPVADGGLLEAVARSLEWQGRKSTDDDVSYVVYGIGEAGALVRLYSYPATSDVDDNSSDTVKVLDYGNDVYAAICTLI